MDAWLKGIRYLTVIYYNYVSSEAANELLRAAEIMGMHVRIGLLFHAPFRGRLVDLIWIPRNVPSAEDFTDFLGKPEIAQLMKEGRSATRWLERRILHILDLWNETERLRLAPLIGGTADPLNASEFMAFVGSGQASLQHLAEFIHKKIFPFMEKRAAGLREALASPELSEGRRIETQASLETLDSFTIEASYHEDLTVRYDAIDSIEYRNENISGTRTMGFASARLLLGTFQNEEFGTYSRYTYYKPEACIVVTVKGDTLVFSGKNAAETQEIYNTLLSKIR
jgi:hypothetical protein